MNALLLLLTAAVAASTRDAAGATTAPAGGSPPAVVYSFLAIDPKWFASKLYLDIAHDRGVLPGDPGPKDQFFLLVNFSETETSKPLKEVEYFPGGRVFRETDLHVHAEGFAARGDVYTRSFREDGKTVCFYEHDHDGKCADGFSVTADGKTERVIDGNGTLTQPSDRGQSLRRFFGDDGIELVRIDGKDIYLTNRQGQWHRGADGTESLARFDAEQRWTDQWKRSPGDQITGPLGGGETDSSERLRERFQLARSEFFAHLSESAHNAGFTLADMGVAQYAVSATTQP